MLAKGGAQVMLVDDQPELGGHLRYRKRAGAVLPQLIAQLRAHAERRDHFAEPTVSACTKATCWACCRRILTRARSSA